MTPPLRVLQKTDAIELVDKDDEVIASADKTQFALNAYNSLACAANRQYGLLIFVDA